MTTKKPSLATEAAKDEAQEIDFQDLHAEALGLDGAAPGAAVPEVAPVDTHAVNVNGLVGLLRMPRAMLASRFGWWPEFGVVWSDDQLRAIAEALETLREHMGWDVDEIMGRFGPWVAVGLTAGMPAWVTWQAMQDRRAQLEAQARQRERRPDQAVPNGPAQ